ncbi:hypothetical protein F0U44_04400 [Nocardioides humilatus]|uniref:Lipoprotein n=1 Tax=Nocardioides humilatus TaxID=2607660 RepID=A0A5B1LLZ4_9ACTN|nr:hypothetical protein [Nocardioides humilatus]KAA1421534.1 hypothetical protein F0U44_04400 [Nocardioides humilatus]
MRARAVVGLVLLVLTPLLAACGDDQDLPKAGDIIRARLDNQFKKARESEVQLPTGRLIIRSGQPVESASADQTRTREVVDAPSGAVLVPISWQYDPWASDKLDRIFATEDSPIVELDSGGNSYRLTPPQPEAEGAESFFVVVTGDGTERTLKITFDGVAQTVDLRTGSREEGDAAGLYDITDEKLKQRSCSDDEKWFDTTTQLAEFECNLTGPVLTPYASGEWAPEGELWLVMTAATQLRVFGETNLFGGGARYGATSTKVVPKLAGEDPDQELSTDDDADKCPMPAQTTCGWSKSLIFSVPADDPEQGPLKLKVSYKLLLGTSWNGYDADKHKRIVAKEKFKIWKKPAKKDKLDRQDEQEDQDDA